MSRLSLILAVCLVPGCGQARPKLGTSTRDLATTRESRNGEHVVRDAADHVAAARAAEAEYHSLCDEWAAVSGRGENTAKIERAIHAAQTRFVGEVLKTKYIPNAAAFSPRTFAAAGQITRDDGTTYSFVIGGGDRVLAMWVWARTEWTANQLPSHGFAGCLGIADNENVGTLKVGKATRKGEGSKTVFRVPYTLNGLSGTVEFRVADFSVHPDRGTVDRGHGWHPNAATGLPNNQPMGRTGRASRSSSFESASGARPAAERRSVIRHEPIWPVNGSPRWNRALWRSALHGRTR